MTFEQYELLIEILEKEILSNSNEINQLNIIKSKLKLEQHKIIIQEGREAWHNCTRNPYSGGDIKGNLWDLGYKFEMNIVTFTFP